MVKTKLERRLIEALEADAAARGFDIVDVELTGATKAPCVRVRLELADGTALSLEDVCAQSGWVGDVVEGIDPVAGSYTLEVSSAGMRRPLRRPADFIRFIGHQAEVSLIPGAEESGRRRWTGGIDAADDGGVTLALSEGETVTLRYEDIQKAALKPSYDFGQPKEGN